MENNVNFRNDLIISYLDRLVSFDDRTEFDKFYPSVEDYIKGIVSSSKNVEQLNKIKNIVTFKAKVTEMKI